MIFKPNELKVDDSVGISPSGMFEEPYIIGIVSKVIKTRITVTYDDNKTRQFIRDTGREYGGGSMWHPAYLVTVAKAEESNRIILPRRKRLSTIKELTNKINKAGADTFTQRQLDTAIMALNNDNCGVLPPVRTDLHEFEKLAQLSVDVLVKVKNHAGFFLGRYIHGLEEWQVNNMGGDAPNVVEWWPLPENK